MRATGWAIGLFMLINAAPMSAAAQGSPTGACAALGAAGASIETMTGAAGEGGEQAAEALCALLVDADARIAAAEAQLSELRTALQLTQTLLPPLGSILLVDDGAGCPSGWTDVALVEPEVFAGRLPVAAGFVEGQTFRGYREIGGSDAVVLEEANLPPHDHALPLAFAATRDTRSGGQGSQLSSGFRAGGSYGDQVATRSLAGRERTERAGAAVPHDNMPPYISLFWCRRD